MSAMDSDTDSGFYTDADDPLQPPACVKKRAAAEEEEENDEPEPKRVSLTPGELQLLNEVAALIDAGGRGELPAVSMLRFPL